MVYNEKLKREIPAGWDVSKIGKITKSYLGGTPSRAKNEYWNNGDVAWLSSGEIANFPVLSANESITVGGLDNSAAKLLISGSIMISITGNIRVSFLGIDASTNQSVVGIEENERYKKEFLYQYIFEHIPQFEAQMTGAVQKHINKEIVDETPIFIPDKNILNQYQHIVEPIFSKILTNSLEVQRLADLRDFILPMLMNEQIEVTG